jgi:hypothetical protein
MEIIFQVLPLKQFCLIGQKFKWVTSLLIEADNHRPVAYIVALLCFCVVVVGLIGIAIEWYRFSIGSVNWRSLAQSVVQILLGIGVPAILLFSIVSRLLN